MALTLIRPTISDEMKQIAVLIKYPVLKRVFHAVLTIPDSSFKEIPKFFYLLYAAFKKESRFF